MSYAQEGPTVPARAMTETDREHVTLMVPLRARDPAAAGLLWRRFAPTVFRMLRRTLGPRAKIDDAVQDVLVRVFRRARRVKRSSDLTLLVFRTASRVAYKRLRRHSPRWLSFRFCTQEGSESGAGRVADEEPAPVVRLYRVIDRLGAWDRIAFVLHFIEGLGPRQVSAVLGSSLQRTRRRLRRGLHEVYAGIRRDPVLRRVAESARVYRPDQ
jgi:RNA polymerase sigma factor (sigma-70 family)